MGKRNLGGDLKRLLKTHWERYKKLPHSYIHCDICSNPEKVTS